LTEELYCRSNIPAQNHLAETVEFPTFRRFLENPLFYGVEVHDDGEKAPEFVLQCPRVK